MNFIKFLCFSPSPLKALPFLFLFLTASNLFGQQTDKKFKKLLYKNTVLKPLLKEKQNYKIQIIYTEINENEPRETVFFNYSPDFYFYPASTIKLPAVLLSLEKLKMLEIDKEEVYSSQSEIENYSSVNVESKETISRYIKEILLVSNNNAFNRLYDFLGVDYFNDKLKEKGFTNSLLRHRLSISLSQAENAYTPQIKLGENYVQDALIATKFPESTKEVLIGKSYFKNDSLINVPMDFRAKNKLDLHDQHKMILSLFFPDALDKNMGFDISKSDLKFVKDYMSRLPRNAGYDEKLFPDGSGKFFMYGDTKERIPENIKIYNKIGGAYGFLIDNAFIKDTKNDIEFVLSAVIYTNENQTLNDNIYEYDSLGLPFLAELGRYMYKVRKQELEQSK